nr:unnamed protein product [Callosobruchus chinensis]
MRSESLNVSKIANHLCKICGNRYAAASSLWRHKKYECSKEPQFQCYVCGYFCKQRGNMRRHLRRQHQMNEEEIRRTFMVQELRL